MRQFNCSYIQTNNPGSGYKRNAAQTFFSSMNNTVICGYDRGMLSFNCTDANSSYCDSAQTAADSELVASEFKAFGVGIAVLIGMIACCCLMGVANRRIQKCNYPDDVISDDEENIAADSIARQGV